MNDGWETIIGLEIHCQLETRSKMFSADPVGFGDAPNTNVSVVSLGHPGALPRPNVMGMELAVRMGLALNCNIREYQYFARKNYFYPDLSKGYQITQDTTPICYEGRLDVLMPDGTDKRVGITRIHIEEDAGKNLHDQDIYDSLVDFNRCGTGLIEIVSEPDMRTPEEAMAYVGEIRKLVRYLEISDGNMEEGNMRVDVNISVRRTGTEVFGTRAEVKNINSISAVGKAIEFERKRQIELYENGETFLPQTRNWDSVGMQTILMREKEEADDYRYFPEPDLQPMRVTDEIVERIRTELPMLPRERFDRYVKEFALPEHDAGLLTQTRTMAEFFEDVVRYTGDYKAVSNWMNGPVRSFLNERAVDISEFPIPAERIAGVLKLVAEGKVNLTMAREELFPAMLEHPEVGPEQLATEKNLIMDTDTGEIEQVVDTLMNENPDKVDAYRGGKKGLLGFFMGQVMKNFQGKADPKEVNAILTQKLEA